MHDNLFSAKAVAVTLADTHEQQGPLDSNNTPNIVLPSQANTTFAAPANHQYHVLQNAWIIGDAEGMSACVAALVRKGIQVSKTWTLNDLHSSVLRRDILTAMRQHPSQWIFLNVTNDVYKWGGGRQTPCHHVIVLDSHAT